MKKCFVEASTLINGHFFSMVFLIVFSIISTFKLEYLYLKNICQLYMFPLHDMNSFQHIGMKFINVRIAKLSYCHHTDLSRRSWDNLVQITQVSGVFFFIHNPTYDLGTVFTLSLYYYSSSRYVMRRQDIKAPKLKT